MPPRKKATADDAAPAPARSSARIKEAANSQPVDASVGTLAPQADAPAQRDSKTKTKRTRSVTTAQDDVAGPKPASKRAKKTKAADVDDAADTQAAGQADAKDDDSKSAEEEKMVTSKF